MLGPEVAAELRGGTGLDSPNQRYRSRERDLLLVAVPKLARSRVGVGALLQTTKRLEDPAVWAREEQCHLIGER